MPDDEDTQPSTEPITPEDLKRKLRDLAGQADETAVEFRQKALAAGAVAAALIILLVFLFGRSRGRKATTVVEVIRV